MLSTHIMLLAEGAEGEWSLFWPVTIGGGILTILFLALLIVVSIGAGRDHS
ncbi:MAG: hypothetical protein WAW88_03935 [Nocardioides sp.]